MSSLPEIIDQVFEQYKPPWKLQLNGLDERGNYRLVDIVDATGQIVGPPWWETEFSLGVLFVTLVNDIHKRRKNGVHND